MDTILVTGGTTGLGLETALYLAGNGYRVFTTTRDDAGRTTIFEEAARRGVRVDVVDMDIADPASVGAAVEAVIAETGAIFGLINNAGIGLRGCFEDLDDAEIRRVYDVNVFGTMDVTRRVLPSMRAAGRGRVVTVTSVGGRVSTFGLSAYCQKKFAQEGFGEELALEFKPLGLHSILVEPGIILTSRWTTNKGTAEHALDPGSPYSAMFRRHEALADSIARRSRTQPVDVAWTILRALQAKKPRMRYVVGRPASVVIGLRRLLPDRAFERLYFGTLLRRLSREEAALPEAVAAGSPGA